MAPCGARFTRWDGASKKNARSTGTGPGEGPSEARDLPCTAEEAGWSEADLRRRIGIPARYASSVWVGSDRREGARQDGLWFLGNDDDARGSRSRWVSWFSDHRHAYDDRGFLGLRDPPTPSKSAAGRHRRHGQPRSAQA